MQLFLSNLTYFLSFFVTFLSKPMLKSTFPHLCQMVLQIYVTFHFCICQNHIFMLLMTLTAKRYKRLSNIIQNYVNTNIIMSLGLIFALTHLLINLPSHNLLPPHIQLQLLVGISTRIAQHVLKGLSKA